MMQEEKKVELTERQLHKLLWCLRMLGREVSRLGRLNADTGWQDREKAREAARELYQEFFGDKDA